MQSRKRHSALLALIASLIILPDAYATECGYPDMPPLQTLVEDMSLPGEWVPHGVPTSYSWRNRGRIGAGLERQRYSSLLTWGQIFESADGSESTNTRVQIRNIRLFLLNRKTGKWERLQGNTNIVGRLYKEDYKDNENVPANVKDVAPGEIAVMMEHGWNYHFYPTSQIDISDYAIDGVIVAFDARLVLDDPAGPDDRDASNFLMSAGADYWVDNKARWNNFTTNGDVGIGRFKRVTPEWRTATMFVSDIEPFKLDCSE